MRKIVATLSSIVCLVACSGSSSSSGTSGSSGIPLNQLATAFGGAACDLFARCNKLYYPVIFSVTSCSATIGAQFQESIFNDLERVTSDGTASYDPALGQACVDALASGACTSIDNDLPEACRSAFKGSVAMGGDCTIGQECSDAEARCDTSAGTCPGKCAPRSSAGIDCQVDADCALGLKCSKITSKCAAPPASGEACGGGVEDECATGLLCVGADRASAKAGSCMTQEATLVGAEGASCSISAGPYCQSGLSCVITALTAALNGVCQKGVTSGAACSIAIPSVCPVGQYCPLTPAQALLGMTANCADLPASGEACAPDVALSVCGKDLVCDSTQHCSARRELGQSCATDDECVSNNCHARGCTPASACAM